MRKKRVRGKLASITQGNVEKMIFQLLDPAMNSSEAKLLSAVLAQALTDLRLRPSNPDRHDAQDYFKRGGHHYLCDVLGLEYARVDDWARRMEGA